MAIARKQTIWLFAVLAATVYAAVFFVTRAHEGAADAGAVGLGAACDLTITVPVLYYLLLVRPGYSSWMALVAVSMAGARAAGFLLPATAQAYLHSLRWMGVPLEIWVVVSVLRGRRRGWAAALLATEAAVFHYALLSWRARPQSAPGSQAFNLAQASGYGMLCILLMAAVVVEGVPMHILLQRWSHTAAWVFSGVGTYSILWMVALYRSLALRPILVGVETVVLQVGFLWRTEVRRDQIREVRRFSAADTDYLSFVALNEPQWLIEFTEPVVVQGPLGRRKTVERIALAIDDGEAFAAAL